MYLPQKGNLGVSFNDTLLNFPLSHRLSVAKGMQKKAKFSGQNFSILLEILVEKKKI